MNLNTKQINMNLISFICGLDCRVFQLLLTCINSSEQSADLS